MKAKIDNRYWCRSWVILSNIYWYWPNIKSSLAHNQYRISHWARIIQGETLCSAAVMSHVDFITAYVIIYLCNVTIYINIYIYIYIYIYITYTIKLFLTKHTSFIVIVCNTVKLDSWYANEDDVILNLCWISSMLQVLANSYIIKKWIFFVHGVLKYQVSRRFILFRGVSLLFQDVSVFQRQAVSQLWVMPFHSFEVFHCCSVIFHAVSRCFIA